MKIKFNKETKRFSLVATGLAIAGLIALAVMITRKKNQRINDYLYKLIDGYDSGRFLRYDVQGDLPDNLIPLFVIPKPNRRDRNLAAIYYEINCNDFSKEYIDTSEDQIIAHEFEKIVYSETFYNKLMNIIKSGKKIDYVELSTSENPSNLIKFTVFDCGRYGKLIKVDKGSEVLFEFKKHLNYASEAIGINEEIINNLVIPELVEVLKSNTSVRSVELNQ